MCLVNESFLITCRCCFDASRSISITDEDAGLGVLELSLSFSNGTLTLSPADGLEWQVGANGTSYQVVRGTLASLNAALAGLSYLQSRQLFRR